MNSYIVEFDSTASLSEIEAALNLLNLSNLKLTMAPFGSLPEIRQVVAATPEPAQMILPTPKLEKSRASQKGTLKSRNKEGLPTLRDLFGRQAELKQTIPRAMVDNYPLYVFHDGVICVKRTDEYNITRYIIDPERTAALLGTTVEAIMLGTWARESIEARVKHSVSRAQNRASRESSAASAD